VDGGGRSDSPVVFLLGFDKEVSMGAEQKVETIKTMYGAFGRGDVDAILELVTDDVDWSTDAAIESAPWYGPKHGKAGVRRFFEGIGQTGPVTEFTPLSFTSNDDGDVMVFIRYAFTVSATGKSCAMNIHHYWKFRDRKVCFVRSSEDTALVAAVLTH
jgi:ketosteroid isomerase-like protein